MMRFISILSLLIISMACSSMRGTDSDSFYSNGTAFSIDRDIAWDKAYQNAVNKINLKNSILVSNKSVRQYDEHQGNRRKEGEVIHYRENMSTESHMSAYGITVKKEKTKRVKNGYEVSLTVAIPKENVESVDMAL